MGMKFRASKRAAARVATVIQLVALATLAGSSGASFVHLADAATQNTGTLLKTVSIPLCTGGGGGSLLSLIAGRLLGSTAAFASFPILLAVGCPTSNTISFVDPNAGTVPTGATVNVTNTPTGGFHALAARPDMGDLIGCANTTVPNGELGTFLTTEVYSIPLTSTSVSATQLFSTTLSGGVGLCDGLTWDSSDKTIYIAPAGTQGYQVYHFSPTGTQLSSFTLAASACQPPAVILGLAVAGSSLFVTCSPYTQVSQVSKDGTTNYATFAPSSAVDGMACDPTTFAGTTNSANGNAALWARDTALNQAYAYALPPFQCGLPLANGVTSRFGPQCVGQGAVTTSTANDGIPDCWKTGGIDIDGDGVVDYTLPDFPSPQHKDVYLEIDSYATGCSTGPSAPSCKPSQAVIDAVVAAFANSCATKADACSPDGSGVHLHVTLDDSLAVSGAMNLPPCTPLPEPANTQDFDTLKRANFGTATERASANATKLLAAKAFVYHYMISASGLAGLGTTSGCSELPGNDLSVALGGWSFSSSAVRDASWEGTLMHELGHNLGLRHGGGAGIDTDSNGNKLSANCKPNYVSIMSYAFQVPGSVPVANWKLDYSHLQLPTLRESALNEAVGVFGVTQNQPPLTSVYTAFGTPNKTGGSLITSALAANPVNWDGDRTAPGYQTVPLNANNFGNFSGCDGTGSTLAGYNDWANLVYAFQNTLDFSDGVHQTSNSGPDNQEITQEQANVILNNTVPLLNLTKTDPATGSVGTKLSYTLKVTNQGSKTATNVSIVDTLPDGVDYNSSGICPKSGGFATCNVGTLPVGGTASFTLTMTPNQCCAVLNRAAVTSDPDTTHFQSNVSTVTSLQFGWSGFFSPTQNPPVVNQVNAGSSIPLKFSLGGNFGMDIFAPGYPQQGTIDCTTLQPNDGFLPIPSDEVSLNFNSGANQYNLNIATPASWVGSCRQIAVALSDGTAPHLAYFRFK
jgi:uncharacterized repeat protein (TIGR01451 family)